MLKKNDEYVAVIEGTGSNGEGVAKIEGCAVFIPYALEGETVKVKIVNAKNSYAFGKLIEVISPSPFRCEPPCPVFYKCGGCNLQHVNYERQLEIKSQTVRDCFKKIACIDVDVPLTVSAGEQYRYRNKLQLPIRNINGKNVIGFFRENSHDIVPIEDCLIQREWVRGLIRCINEYISLGVSCFNDATGKGYLKHVVAREVGGKLIVVIVCTSDKILFANRLKEILQREFKEFSLFFNTNKLNNNVVLGDKFTLVYGEEKIMAQEGGLILPMGPESFMQVNDGVRKLIYDKVSAAVNENANSTVIDAYSGAGFLTAMLARRADRVYGIECVREAVDCANRLAEENGLSGKITNVCGLCEDVLPELIKKEDGDICVVLDPPRKGCARAVVEAVAEANPKKLIYVSCNPSTLARDVGLLLGTLGYDGNELKKTGTKPKYNMDFVQPYDMFPNTRHVETVVRLSRQ